MGYLSDKLLSFHSISKVSYFSQKINPWSLGESEKQMKRDLHDRLRKFAKRMLRLAVFLKTVPGARRLAEQISGCGPSIGLNYAESQAASSRNHFISRIETAEREARETQAALEMIIDAEYVNPKRLIDLYTESCEIVAILTTIAKNAKANREKGKRRKR